MVSSSSARVHSTSAQKLVVGRLAAELLLEVRDAAADLPLPLLEPARRAHHPALVAEPPLHLAPDRRDGVGQQVGADGRVELVHRLHQPLVGGLVQIFDRDAPASVAVGHGLCHAAVDQDHLVEQRLAALSIVGCVRFEQQFGGSLLALGAGDLLDCSHALASPWRAGLAPVAAVRGVPAPLRPDMSSSA
ncbi:MAG TPA: hypothetical protein PL137_04900 [Nocardioides sp.]|nr:hypothetical protein [Nocardioides sp.]